MYRIRNNGQEILENYGFLRIMLSSSKYSIKMHFRFQKIQIINQLVRKKNFKKIFLDYNNLELLPVISKNNFFSQIKKREIKTFFMIRKFHQKILVTENFNDIEKYIFPSLILFI